jgi:signal transduction histidine kinase
MARLLGSRLFFRLLAVLCLAAGLPLAGAAWVALELAEETVLEETRRRQSAMGELVAALVVDALARAEAKLSTVGRLVAEAPRDEHASAARELSSLVDPPDVFLRLQHFAAGDEPAIVAQVQQAALPLDEVANRVQIRDNMANAAVRLPLREGRTWRAERFEQVEGVPSLSLSVPLSADGRVSGALVAYLDPRPLANTLARFAASDRALSVRDEAGAALLEVGAAAEPTLGVEVAVPNSAWCVRVSEPAALLEAPLARLRQRIGLWSALAALLSAGLALLLASWIARPVARLRAAVVRMESGDLAARSRVRGPDELGRLGTAFDRMAESLEGLDRAKSDFVAHVSHELRTPLTSLRLSVENLLDGVRGELAPAQRETLARVRGDLERMERLVEDLLELARLEAGAVRPAREAVDLAALAREAAQDLAPAAAQRGVRIEVDGAGHARCDAGLMRRVLANLLDNAVKFSPQGGRVVVAVREDELCVADQGPGVSSERVFERFHKEHAGPGAGLGLSIVKKLVELQDGQVGIGPPREDERSGAVFVVRWPG